MMHVHTIHVHTMHDLQLVESVAALFGVGFDASASGHLWHEPCRRILGVCNAKQ